MKPTNKNTLLAIPNMGWLRAELVTFIHKTKLPLIQSVGVTPHSKARNYLFGQFLMSDYEFLLMVDSDTVPPEAVVDMLGYLITHGADVATGITPIRKNNKACVNVWVDPSTVETCVREIPSQPFQVLGAGMSCMLITRKIAQKVWNKTKQLPCRTIEFENGNFCSEDLYFCDQVTELGGTIVADPEVQCAHFKEMPILFPTPSSESQSSLESQ